VKDFGVRRKGFWVMLCGGGGAAVLVFLEIFELCSFGSWKCRTEVFVVWKAFMES
jgi:hypothetical protein